MNKPPIRKYKNYNKKLVKIILDNIDDDDYFYNKKEYSAMLLEDILYVLKEY